MQKFIYNCEVSVCGSRTEAKAEADSDSDSDAEAEAEAENKTASHATQLKPSPRKDEMPY